MDCWHPFVVDGMSVRCGHCLPCLQHRQAEWIFRLQQEMKFGPVYFVTLTYNDANLPVNVVDLSDDPVPSVKKKDLQIFHARLRACFQRGYYYDDSLVRAGFRSEPSKILLPLDVRFSYYCTAEYGPNGNRPHYHGVYFHLPEDDDLVFDLFNHVWNKGFITCEIGNSAACAAYTTKYLINTSFVSVPDGADPVFSLMSKGLGKSYLENEKIVEFHRSAPAEHSFCMSDGHKTVMPRYYRNKIYDDDVGKPELQAYAQRKADSIAFRRSRLSREEFLKEMDDEYRREKETINQAKWRFIKNGKLK